MLRIEFKYRRKLEFFPKSLYKLCLLFQPLSKHFNINFNTHRNVFKEFV